jgi:tight adherence protein B
MIVSIMPAVILVLLTAGAESYMEPLYETVAGRLVMTAAGAIFGLSWYTGKKITSLEV